MDRFLFWAVTVLVLGYLLFITFGGLGRARDARTSNRRLRSAGNMYSQYGSVMGRNRVRYPGGTFWFLVVCCLVILAKVWWF